jgi:hypothetical protein
VGVPYKQHITTDSNYKNIIGKSDIFYCGYIVENPNFRNKVGIFQDRYQPYFTDFIGTCGPKEKKLIRHSSVFERSSVEVLDCVDYDLENNQSYYKLNYKCGRKRYVDGGSPKDLLNLINYMVQEGWNFPWDKTAINDISYNGLVSDVADMFESRQVKHQLGTVYSILYSLSKIDKTKYLEFLKSLKLKHNNDMDYIFLSIYLLRENNVNVDLLFSKKCKDDFSLYKNVIRNFLMQGRNCAHVEDKTLGDKVSSQYITRFDNMKVTGVV